MYGYEEGHQRPNERIYTIGEIADAVRPIAARHGLSRLYLFGSYARGEPRSDSDIDLYLQGGDVDDYFALGSLYVELNEALGKEIDLVSDGCSDSFKSKIADELVLVYESA